MTFKDWIESIKEKIKEYNKPENVLKRQEIRQKKLELQLAEAKIKEKIYNINERKRKAEEKKYAARDKEMANMFK